MTVSRRTRGDGAGSRRGASVPEAVVALLVGLLVVHLALRTVEEMRSAQARLAKRTDALVALRVGRYVVRSELRVGLRGRDWVLSDESLSLRAFRGTATVCPIRPAPDELLVRYRGTRSPDPAKDSLLLLTARGGAEVRALAGMGAPAGSCAAAGAGALAQWRLDREPAADVVLARLFERGSYHLAGSALRYERGLSGRQPLTPEVWSHPSTTWTLSAERLGVRLVPRDADAGAGWSGFLAWASRP